jgi:hypothetical protein
MTKKELNTVVNDYVMNKEYNKAWQYVKHICAYEVPDSIERFIIFNKIASQFDANLNKSFMAYYKKCLKQAKFDVCSSATLTDNKRIAKILINRQISPEIDKRRKPVIEELERWEDF